MWPRRFVHEDWGGVETYVLGTGRRMKAMGHDLEVVCPSILSDVREEEIGGLLVTRTLHSCSVKRVCGATSS